MRHRVVSLGLVILPASEAFDNGFDFAIGVTQFATGFQPFDFLDQGGVILAIEDETEGTEEAENEKQCGAENPHHFPVRNIV